MHGKRILQAELEAIAKQIAVDDSMHEEAYPVYVDEYPNYGDWFDCKDWH